MSNPAQYGHHALHDRSQRPLHVVVSGAGPSGIALAIELKKMTPHGLTFGVYEKNREVGGTWLENRYPGAACDVASHAYQYTFASKKDWSCRYVIATG
jgi:cation diffusion facilitator CzcD-associated flavoprotein CzcO